MPTAVHCMVETDRPYALVRVSGVLDLAGSVPIRSAVLRCLAEQPQAVLVDLARTKVADPTALSVFLAVARQAAMWPAIPLVLCAPRPETAALLRARALDQRMPVLPSVAEAARRLDAGGRAPSVTDELLPVVGAARRARELVTEACVRWRTPELAGPACTVVTELVNNVVVHAHTMMTLRLSLRGQFLHVAVRDGSPEPPVLLRDMPLTAPSGRGMALVAAVSRRWGSLPTNGGKVVWAVLG
jgi:anti-anti-sigma factor